MNSYHNFPVRHTGISMIEALISLTVLSFGLLAIATFQTSLIGGSGDSKVRSQAMTLAQEKLDDLRSYTSVEEMLIKLKHIADPASEAPATLDDFPADAFPSATVVDCDFTATTPPVQTYPATAETFPTITTADFKRQWKICRPAPTTTAATALGSDEQLYAMVEVSWTDRDNTTQSVNLTTTLSYRNVTSTASLGDIPEEPLIPSATGRAYLGDGSVTAQELQDALDAGDATPNDDGTITLYKANDGGDVALVDEDTGEIVLTLVDACKTQDGSCFGFVKVSGRIYLDRSTSVNASDVYVLASDAAFCARVGSDSPSSVTDIDNADGSDYTYFDYTCYLGGGWYGNVGLLITSNSNNTYACVGDPYTVDTGDIDGDGDTSEFKSDGAYKWMRTELATRRVYRGMVYVREDDGSGTYPLWRTDNDGGTATIGDIANEPLHYSKGIGDSVLLPDTNWAARSGGHDYLVIDANGTNLDYTECTVPLTRPDSRAWIDADDDGVIDAGELGELGSLFEHTPTDFVCLNSEDPANDPRTYPYLDNFNGEAVTFDSNEAVYGALAECPYDPSRPPSNRWLVKGTLYNTFMADNDYTHLAGTSINTSDAAQDCWLVDNHSDMNAVENPTSPAQPYVCQVYEWGNGWSGSIILKPTVAVTCSATSHSYTDTTPYPVDRVGGVITDDYATAAENFYCENLNEYSVAGTVTAVSQDLTGIRVIATRTEDGYEVDCTTPIGADVSTLSYSCLVTEYELGQGWNGTVEVITDATPSIDCPAAHSYAPLPAVPSPYVENFACQGPPTYHTLILTVDSDGVADVTDTAITIPDATTTCGIVDNTADLVTYDCTVMERGSGWSGSFGISPVLATVSCDPAALDVAVAHDGTVTGTSTTTCGIDLTGPVRVSGTVTSDDKNADLATLTITATETSATGAAAPATQQCVPNSMDFTDTVLSGGYTCTVADLPKGTTWRLTVDYSSSVAASTCSGPVEFTGVEPIGPDGVDYTLDLHVRKLTACP